MAQCGQKRTREEGSIFTVFFCGRPFMGAVCFTPPPLKCRVLSLHCALSLAAQCIIIGPVCEGRAARVCGCVCLWVCYHDKSKLRTSILTKLGM